MKSGDRENLIRRNLRLNIRGHQFASQGCLELPARLTGLDDAFFGPASAFQQIMKHALFRDYCS
ncbi:hypothetical protein [Hyphomonas sp. UBA4494]|jgi:hypothetical protein|uniref:hypothetical protein n=1 Tax=Hyphomonas sp. UBA4494 TaxID=1946631 RepID=UPI0025C1D40F|nr:hypothetical protein [Hyphomonas sp. UBA4494]